MLLCANVADENNVVVIKKNNVLINVNKVLIIHLHLLSVCKNTNLYFSEIL